MTMELFTAAKQGDLEKSKTILENETGDTKLTLVNDLDPDGKTPLHIASEEGHIDLVKYFIDVGADLEKQSNSGNKPLHFASLKGHLEVVQYLISKGGDVNEISCDGLRSSPTSSLSSHSDSSSEDYRGHTPLCYASRQGHFDVVECLVNAGAEISKSSYDGSTPLYAAASKGHLDIIEYLISKGADHIHKGYRSKNPLYIAALNGHLEVVKYLISKEAGIDIAEDGRYTPLRGASEKGHLDIVERLVNAGADVNKSSFDGSTPIYAAANKGHLDVVEYLTNKGAQLKQGRYRSKNPLHIAAINGHLGVVKYFISKGADIEIAEYSDYTPLHGACESGHLDIAKCLVNAGADVNKLSAYGEETPLHTALHNGHLDVVKYLISQGADIDKDDYNGCPPLYYASLKGHLDVVECLVNAGADVNKIHTHQRDTSLYAASQNGHLDVVKYLISKQADISKRAQNGQTVLHVAAFYGHLDIVKYLLTNGEEINVEDDEKCTSLHAASKEGHLHVVKCLVEAGANINQSSQNGYTPLSSALQRDHQGIVEFFMTREAEIGTSDDVRSAALCKASSMGNLDAIRYIMHKGVDLNCHDTDGFTPLYKASEKGHLNVVEFLENSGADIKQASYKGRLSLHASSMKGHLDVVKYLISQGAELSRCDNDGQTPLHAASREGHLEVIKHLISQGADIKTSDKDGFTVLHVASRHGHLAVAEYLVNAGADVNKASKDGHGPLYTALDKGHLDIVHFLMSRGADVGITDDISMTALRNAFFYDYHDVIKYLIGKIKALNGCDIDGKTPLYIASKNGLLDIVECLVNKGADINKGTNDGDTPIHAASTKGHLHIVKYLIDKGAEVDGRGYNGETPLCAASFYGHLDVVKYLISKGAKTDMSDKDGYTPIFNASHEHHFDVVECLVNAGADLNKAASYDDTAIHAASYKGELDIVKYLIDRGAEVNKRGFNGQTPLHIASFYGHLDVVKYLISKGVNLDIGDRDGYTPLYVASLEGHPKIMECLVKAGADIDKGANDGDAPIHATSRKGHLNILKYLIDREAVNKRGFNGGTPLFSASFWGHLEVVKYLISKGANPDIGDQDGYTPLYVASQKGHPEILECLVKAGADIDKGANDGDAPIHAASRKGYIEIMKYLTTNGAQIETRNEYGWTVLHYASDNGHVELLEYLLGNKIKSASGITGSTIEIGLQTSTGVTPLMLAARGGHVECVRLLLDNKADVETEDAEGWTALHYAAASGNSTVVKDLLGRKESMITKVSRRGQSPLSVALISSNADIAKYLLDKDVTSINGSDSGGLTPIHHATISGLTSIIEELLSRGADVNLQSHDGQTPLHLAIKLCRCKERDVEETPALKKIQEESDDDISAEEALIQYLLNQGSKFDIEDKDGFIPSQYAKDERIRQMVFQRNLTEKDVHAFRDLPIATSTGSHRNVGCQGGILYVDGCDVTMSIPPRNMQAGSCHDVSVGITTDHPPIRERGFLTGPGLDIVLPAQWRYSTDQPVMLTVPHAASVSKSSAGHHGNIIWKEREVTSVQRQGSFDESDTQCIIKEKKMKLSIYETSFIKGKVQLWIPMQLHRQADGKRMMCTPFLPTNMAQGEDITLRVYIHEDIPYFVQKIQKEEENRLYRQVHPGRCFVLESELGDHVLECNGIKEIISPSELFHQHMKVFPMRVAKEPDTRTQMINISISSSNGKAKTSMAFMALQTGFSTDIGSTAEEIYSGPSTELSNFEEVNTAKMNTAPYYNLGKALGLSYQRLDSIQFRIRQDKGSSSQSCSLEDGGGVTLNQKAATVMIRHWRKLQNSKTQAEDDLHEVWKSVSDSEEFNPFIKQGRSTHKNISKLSKNEPEETMEDVFTESRHEEPLLAHSVHAHGLELQISVQMTDCEGRVHKNRTRTPSVRSASLSSLGTMTTLLLGSLVLFDDEVMSRHSEHKHKRTFSVVRHGHRHTHRVRSVPSISEQHEHNDDPDSFVVEEHRTKDILAWMEAAEESRLAAGRPRNPSSKRRDDEEEIEGSAHPNYSQGAEPSELTQVRETGNTKDIDADTGVIRLEKHDIEVGILPGEAYGAEGVPLMERAEEGKPATVRLKETSSKPKDDEEETTSGPFHLISLPSRKSLKQAQDHKTKNREDASEDTGVIRIEKHGIEVRIPPNEGHSAKDITVAVIEEVPPELVLKEKEVIIAVGLKLSPSHLQFNSPVKVTMRHSAIFSNTGKADIILYTRRNDIESFSAIPCEASGIPRCVVRQRDLDLYIDHFSEWWIVAYIRGVFIGKRVICTPYVPIPTIRNTEYRLYLCITDDNNGSPEERKGYEIPFQPTQYYVKWRHGDLTISYFHGTSLIDTKNVTEEKLYYLTNQQVAFPLNTKGNIGDRLIITYRLKQSIEEHIEFPIDIEDSYSGTSHPASKSGKATKGEVTDDQLEILSKHLPSEEYTLFCAKIGIKYDQAKNILAQSNKSYRAAVRECLAQWKVRTGGSLDELKEILVKCSLKDMMQYLK